MNEETTKAINLLSASWDFEKLVHCRNAISDLYLATVFSHIEKEMYMKRIYDISGWTYEELIEECERRIESE